MPADKDVLTTGEVAKICNVAPRTVSKWFDSGQLKGYRIPGSKDRRIPLNNLLQFMKAHGIPLDGVMSGKSRVLIVDDQRDVTDVLKKLLVEQAGYEVRVAATGFEAGVHGNDDLAMTRIIAMSGKLTDGQAAGLRQQGFDSFLKKPFQVRQVIEAIEKANSLVH